VEERPDSRSDSHDRQPPSEHEPNDVAAAADPRAGPVEVPDPERDPFDPGGGVDRAFQVADRLERDFL